MNVIHVGAGMIPIPPPDYGAVEKHIWNLGQALERLGHEVGVVNDVFGQRSVDEYRFARWAASQVKKLDYDVLHLHTPGVASVFSLLGPKEFVYTTHSRHWATVNGLGERIGFALERRTVARARETIAVSPLVARAMAEIRRPHVIPNGVDVDLYRPLPENRTGNRIVGLGEIAEHKKWHVAAEAVKGTPWHLTIAGPFRDTRYATRVEETAPGQVTLLGPVGERELVQLLGESDVQVHPSVSESFGMAVVEGMAAGLPVVAGEVVKDLVVDGETGCLLPPMGQDAALAAALRERLQALFDDAQLRARMGEAARNRAVETYSWNAVAEQVARVYQTATLPG